MRGGRRREERRVTKHEGDDVDQEVHAANKGNRSERGKES
jgi:hypothetical protein